MDEQNRRHMKSQESVLPLTVALLVFLFHAGNGRHHPSYLHLFPVFERQAKKQNNMRAYSNAC